jgi:hypothetical protein
MNAVIALSIGWPWLPIALCADSGSGTLLIIYLAAVEFQFGTTPIEPGALARHLGDHPETGGCPGKTLSPVSEAPVRRLQRWRPPP